MKDTNKGKRMENYVHANSNHKKAEVAILISAEIYFKTENVDSREGYFMIRGWIYHKVATVINVYIPNNQSTK